MSQNCRQCDSVGLTLAQGYYALAIEQIGLDRPGFEPAPILGWVSPGGNVPSSQLIEHRGIAIAARCTYCT
jgi:hypothetical protein